MVILHFYIRFDYNRLRKLKQSAILVNNTYLVFGLSNGMDINLTSMFKTNSQFSNISDQFTTTMQFNSVLKYHY